MESSQASSMLQNERRETVLSNGMTTTSTTDGVVSYDFSGQVTSLPGFELRPFSLSLIDERKKFTSDAEADSKKVEQPI